MSPTAKTSWVESANTNGAHFPIQNLPFGVFSLPGERRRCGAAIGDLIVDLAELERAGLLAASEGESVFDRPALNAFMALGSSAWARVRAGLTDLLAADRDQ